MKTAARRLRGAITIFMMLALGASGAWAQTDYSGYYYISGNNQGTDSYKANDRVNNYYLCPTVNWIYYDAGNTNKFTATNNGQPFLTTYQYRNGVNDSTEAVWHIVKHASLNYYYIIHEKTGKYLASNASLGADCNANRLRVHLETVATPPPAEDRFLFTITKPSYYNISPKAHGNYLNVTQGNQNSLQGATSAKKDGPTGYKEVGGTLGLWTSASDYTSKWYFEEAFLEFPSITINGSGNVEISTHEADATIYYTTDGSDPLDSGTRTAYTGAITPTSSMTTIKARVIHNSNGRRSEIATQPLYTYHIVNLAGEVAIKQKVAQYAGARFSNYLSIPAAIRSPYLEGETLTFYSFSGAYNSANLVPGNVIEETPASSANIYVTYTNTDLMSKFLHLRAKRTFNLTINGEYIYDDSGTLAHEASPSDAEKESNPYLWYIGKAGAEDPYAVLIRNKNSDSYFHYATPATPSALSLDGAPSKFILLSGSAAGDGANYEQMELMAATGDDNYYRIGRTGDALNISTTATGDASLQVRAYPVGGGVTYWLIDKAGKLIEKIPSKSTALALPEAWKSPLVDDEDYHYFPTPGYDEGTGTYTPTGTIEGEIDPDLTPNIYVTYDVNDKVEFYNPSGEAAGTTYILKFSGGESFKQENGLDGVMASAQKAVYPYSNGDAMLYVYGQDRWDTQLASGASTRNRWLWYVESPTNDPYHVKIRSYSYSNQVSSNNFFRTYVVNYGGSNHVVTGVTTMNEAVSNPESANYQPPTEYMVLRTDNGQCKLVTLDQIDDGTTTERRTVTSFEQYWKNNPTVQSELGGSKVTVTETYSSDIVLNSDQLEHLPNNWHTYKAFAYAAPWVGWVTDNTGTSKQYLNKNHWFQTIDMGSTGAFTFEATSLEPQVILLDQHGWEIMRAPLSDVATLRKYDSPMVEEYHWYPTAEKAGGYHKFTVSDQAITVYYSTTNPDNGRTVWQDSFDRYTHNSTSLTDNPYSHIAEHDGWEEQPASVKTDFYVTYTVKPEFEHLYTGAATEGATSASAFLLKQGTQYAKNAANTLTTVTTVPENFEDITTDLEWNLRPNFNIDAEMGYKYLGEPGAQEDALSKSATEAAYFTAGKNGFDPYNMQVQSTSSSDYYFTTNTTGSHLSNGAWVGEGTGLSLQDMRTGVQPNVDGYDQTRLNITNATFMVVNDGSGHMRLMPRFDHSKVISSFSGTQLTPLADAEDYLTIVMLPKVVHSSDDLVSLSGNYILAEDFTFESSFESLGNATTPFTGSINGGGHTFSGLSVPLLAYAENAIVKNLILDGVDINITTDGANAGAIAAVAKGDTRIYSCGILSGSVGGTEKVGGLVGLLDGYARVIHCYSYATITGGEDVGGIVGYNNYASKASDIRTMVMNCIFYGDITGGTNVSPVYGGLNINNLNSGGLNTFNYYAYDELKSMAITNNKYNCALAIEEKNLKRFEFYRLLLNSNRRLAAYYATSSYGTVHEEDMMKFVLETADRSIVAPNVPKPYPVLKPQEKYPSIINYDVEHAPSITLVDGRPSEEDRNKGGRLGTLSVTISQGSGAPDGATITNGSLTLTRTDKDPERFNFNYDKVQLPYYNDVGTKNYTGNKVVTGWKITGITAVDGDPYAASNYPASGAKDYPDYNFADRKSSNKDLNSVSGRVFSQGAYFDVPYGVTAITIEPYWGTAAYIADKYLDVVYSTAATYASQKVTQLGETFPTGKITIDGSEQTVYTGFTAALGALTGVSDPTVYDYAVVLVGNLHQENVPSDETKPFTVMSADLNHDNEPDYSMIYHHPGRKVICPIRFDFLNIPGTAQAQKPNAATSVLNFTIFKTKGWFETTNTVLVYSNQVEYENKQDLKQAKADAPLILLGGDFEQFVSTQSQTVDGHTTYIHVGGNVHIQSFGLGTHGDGKQSTPHIPVSVTGGEFDGFYLSGTYNQDAIVRTNDNAECYISGGHFIEAAGASQEQIDGNVHWQIYDADIDAFYGGGVNAAKPITGDVTVDIFNSHVPIYCGGPKFGDMQSGKKVTTTAEGCVFGKFFGGGYGGTSYSRKKYYDSQTTNWTSWSGRFTTDRGKYFDGKTTVAVDSKYGFKGVGVATDFDYEFFVWSTGGTGGRLYVHFASFSLATCNDVESNLKDCVVNENFYGGGSYGEVKGKATSVLDGCTVHGNVFGGGYSAELPTLEVRNGTFTKVPNFNQYSGMFEPGSISTSTTECNWEMASEMGITLTNGQSGSHLTGDTPYYVCTDVDLHNLGKVGATDLTITGNTLVEGGVFGGGDMSDVTPNPTYSDKTIKGDTKVTIQNGDGSSNKIPNVYGGGNTADVDGDTEVIMANGTVSHDIYGGGRGETTTVGGNVTVNIGERTGEAPSFSYPGTGIVEGDVYGGSALGAVNATKGDGGVLSPAAGKVTTVNVYAGTVNGSVFGGGLGQAPTVEPVLPGVVAQNFGNTTVHIENNDNEKALVKTAVYGGANVNGVMKADATVTLLGGTVGTAWTTPVPDPLPNVVFGGGRGKLTLVNGNDTVNVGTMTPATPPASPTYAGAALVYGNVYGGSALGNTAASGPVDALVFDPTKVTNVNLYGGTIHGNVFGGGLGQKNGENGATSDILSYVGGDVNVLLDGAKLVNNYTGEGVDYKPVTGQIFGANNLNGTPKGHVKVHVKRTVDSAKPVETPRDSRTTYDVAAVYGGGNKADYRPADAELDPAVEGNPAKIDAACAEVIIEGCDVTSIEYVYGGGNAAAVPATDVTILGDYIIDYVFGGGNGRGTGNPGANIGTYDNGTTDYGLGRAVTKLVGGHIHRVFGGSNTLGNVRGGTSISMPEKDPTYTDFDCCDVRDIKEIYGAGNEAEQDGDVTLILGCVDNMDYVYGGARNADVKGGVDLVITSGHFKGVFGGNDTSGTIQGPIKVTIEETGCDPLVIDNLYLGGNLAAYSVYGYKDDGEGHLVARTSMSDGVAVNAPADDPESDIITEQQLYRDPELNVISCTSIGNMFGGGFGASAVMYGNPTVNVNMIKGNQAGLDNTVYLPKEYEDIPNIQDVSVVDENTISCKIKNEIGSIGNVYGGGSAANVIGDTHVNICTEATVSVRSNMGAPIDEGDRTPTAVEGAMITGNVFGAGLGLETVVNNTTIVMAGGNVKKSVYGGGELGSVNADTHITVTGGEIGDITIERGGAEIGNVYGGGKGECDTEQLSAGLIKGNTYVNITGGSIYHNIYGGGAYGSVGTYTYNPSTHENIREGSTGVANISITGGTIGINGKENGMVFGSSRGDVAKPTGSPAMDPNDMLAWVYDTNVTIGTTNDETPGPVIKGSIYGSGENGHTYRDTHVTIHSGIIGINEGETVTYYKDNIVDPANITYTGKDYNYPYRGNVYGGGCGTDMYDSDTDGTADAYNPKSGIVMTGTATVVIDGGQVVNNVYGAGAMGSSKNTSVTITGAALIGVNEVADSEGGNVYAAARGDMDLDPALVTSYATVEASTLTISGGTVKGDAFGGGKAGYVTGTVDVSMTAGSVAGDVYGGGALAKTNVTEVSPGVYPATNVTLSGGTITGNLYGGGLGQLAAAGPPAVAAVAADVLGPVKVVVSGGRVANVFGCNNINGAPQRTVDVEIGTRTGEAPSFTYGGTGIIGNVYGGGNMAAYAGTPTVKLYGGTVENNVYGGGLGATAITGGTSVTMEGGMVSNDVYGGGSQADVTGSVSVSIKGGTVVNDVYGGGALANTNTANWDGDGSVQYVALTVKADPTDEELAAGVLKTGVTPVAGYFTEAAGVYTRITNPDAKADGGTTYYKKAVNGTWAEGKTSASNTTTVSLTGGYIGNAYGGGLGNSTTAANVYGDVTVTVNEGVTNPAAGIVFNQLVEHPVIGGTDYPTPTKGRVFGCNNFNGTPTGDVTVHVYATRQIQKDTESTILPGHGSSDRKFSYEIQAVYGGGNQADYLPATGKKSQVIIDGCEETSIEKVYGGGNSAVVPATDVLILGGYDIGYGFGGGNGGRPIKKEDGIWYENEGAIVIGTAKIDCRGGKIGQVFGGGDSKGSCGNTALSTAEEGTGTCPLWITRLYGAGNEGDVSHVNIILAACSGNAIEYVHGGSYNAHVHGDITLTITSGILKNVYGGNDSEGGIEGDITVNIEETDGCNPIIIQNLVGGGNEAAYPGTLKPGGVETPIVRHGKITVNVKSATRIDNVYGGSFNAEADANTEININMMKGNKAGTTVDIPKEFSYIPNISGISNNPDGKTIHCTIDDAIGTIGNVYGGGKQGLVKGNAQVNINSSAKVYIMKRNGEGKVLDTNGNVIDAKSGENIAAGVIIDCTDEHDVEGAHITGDVFGGGENANVTSSERAANTGNAEVYICANKTGEGTYAAISQAADNVLVSNGSVYGGGSNADVHGNTRVTMAGGYVFDGVYGGGLHGSVGSAAVDGEGNPLPSAIEYHTGAEAHAGCVGKIVTYKTGTGKCTVVVSGGQVGPAETAWENGGMKNTGNLVGYEGGPVDVGFVFGAGRGEVEDPAVDKDADFRTFVKETDVTIGGTAFIMAAVYGGGENGRVHGNTLVKIQGDCQIGCGEEKVDPSDRHKPVRYTAAQWAGEDPSDFTECASWDYGEDTNSDGIIDSYKCLPYDPLAKPEDTDASTTGTDGHTYYGCVFGGGSGYYPHEKADGTHDWLRSAGQVEGSTRVEITGGHILTSVYGGNETTDVLGDSCVVIMTGGTLGVPRTDNAAKAHPVTCYLFGAGKGDQRTRFNTWTNVENTRVYVGGTARIFGSVFGGGEDGHILKNAKVQIYGGKIGTKGTSYVDGNIFGGGRGFSGVALTAGSTGGNVDLTITNGIILGSVYGGGRLASVGIGFTTPTDPLYGQLIDETGTPGDPTHGHITVNISGGTIGNDEPGAQYGGYVFGAGMGRNTLLDGTTNPLWPKVATSKVTEVNISGGTIKKNVYGGGEYGIVRNRATVNVSGGIINGSVFGAGRGSDDYKTRTTIKAGGYAAIPTQFYTFTPMIWNGVVSGNTFVNISGGKVGKNVYGGGELASVGLMNFNSNEAGDTYNYITKHESLSDGFGLSWPYKFEYIQHAPDDATNVDGKAIGGKATVRVTGGRIGTTGNTGFVFGGSKGAVAFEDMHDVNEQRYLEAFCANVRETEVTIGYASTPANDDGSTTNCIVGCVYGGAQDGHVMENSVVRVTGGLIGQSLFGGGEGESTYMGKLRNQSTQAWNVDTEPLCSWTAGKVYGNTSVNMTGGHVMVHVYGGGNLASVGKGNYAGGADDYYPAGYGETLTGNLWDNVSDMSKAFLSSGNSTVSITGGEVGALNGISGTVFGTTEVTPTGLVFGGSRGRAAKDVMLDPRHEYAPDFYLGYVNNTAVTIGSADGSPRIYSQVFGGGRDGHVRGNSHVIINNGIIGQTYAETTAAGGSDADYQRYHRGNVYGSGSGLGDWNPDPEVVNHGMSSGSVTRNTTVDINGGTIYNNVYGGGALSSVGPPRIDMGKDYAPITWSKCVVNINGGTIGDPTAYNDHQYGGCVYGASRGNDFLAGESPDNFATVLWTQVNINPHPTDRTKDAVIAGKVYGGGQGGLVWKDTDVKLTGGVIKHNTYGGGQGTTTIAANVGGNTKVELNPGVGDAVKGCTVKKVFGCNDLNGTPKGSALVHVYATQKEGQANVYTKVPSYHPNQGDAEASKAYLNRVITEAKACGISASDPDITAAETLASSLSVVAEDDLTPAQLADIKAKTTEIIKKLEPLHQYDVDGVYGGGDLAQYEPTDPEGETTVIIEGCDVTSIRQVYGGGNAAPVPATDVTVSSCYLIEELFGGGNGLDNYVKGGKWYENPGANVGYYTYEHYDTGGSHGDGLSEATKYESIQNTSSSPAPYNKESTEKEDRVANYSYGTGRAETRVTGGRIRFAYGGSNEKGNIRTEALLQLQQAGVCNMAIGETYPGSKNSVIDAELNTIADCVDDGGTLYGGSMSADVNNDVNIRITNGHYDKIFGGNNRAGTIRGKITITIEENGCSPITIDELYAGGNLAPYSIYGYGASEVAKDKSGNTIYADDGITPLMQKKPLKKGDAGALATPYRNPHINIISATHIGTIYGGGYGADVIGTPHINVNMTTGRIRKAFEDKDPSYAELEKDENGDLILPIGNIGNVFGGGNIGDIIGDTHVEIGTGTHHNEEETEEVIEPARNAAFITGNVYGGGRMGHVGDFTFTDGKPTSCADGTGIATVVVSNGAIGPNDMAMFHLDGTGNVPADDNPDNAGHVFGGGMGTNLPADKYKAYVDSAEVIINGTAWVKGSVFGGGENGHVLNNAGVKIGGNSQIGNGHIFLTDGSGNIIANTGVNRPYTAVEWEAGHLIDDIVFDPSNPANASQKAAIQTAAKSAFSASLPEVDCWLYGKKVVNNRVVDSEHHSPYDVFANATGNIEEYPTKPAGRDDKSTEGGHRVASSGRVFNGSVYGGGSGFFPYEPTRWEDTAGMVEGDTWVEITGGHILASLYGGCEMTSIGGDAHVIMKGGTVGVPRTLAEIDAHPVTCYVFGGGKGEGRPFLDHTTNVRNALVDIQGGWIYGSVFGGAEDGHILGNAQVTIREKEGAAANPTYADLFAGNATKIGTWGTSYVDGNIFGGGRGFDGHNVFAGNVGGNVTVNITGGKMLGSVYGGGRLGSVGLNQSGTMQDGDDHGQVSVNISGGTIGNNREYVYIYKKVKADDSEETNENLITGIGHTEWGDYASFREKIADEEIPEAAPGTSTLITEEAYGSTQTYKSNRIKKLYHTKGGNVYAGGMGRLTKINGTINPIWHQLGRAKETLLNISGGTIKSSAYGGAEYGQLEGGTTVNFTGGTIGTEVLNEGGIPQYTFGSLYGGGYGDTQILLTSAEKAAGKKTHKLTDAEIAAGATVEPRDFAGYVAGNTAVNMSTGTVKASVYGGGKQAQVGGNAAVTVTSGEVGLNKVRKDDGYVMYGSSEIGNVYGSGFGSLDYTKAGLVKGNTNVSISGGNIYHMVYGGGALASVGTFKLSNGTDDPTFIPLAGIPWSWTAGTGTATVTITGGTIGISGRDNGLVFGSSRGDLQTPVDEGGKLVDPYDRVAWVNQSIVNIGTEGSADLTSPHIKGSVYGGGENGHNDQSATVNVYSGTIGISDDTDPHYIFEGDEAATIEAQTHRGNVYGAGSGSDTYTGVDGKEYYNPKSGMVGGNTFVNIAGGHVGRSVYGGGAMAMVGTIINEADTLTTAKHASETSSFALSWPYKFEFAPNTGKATVNITGGHIGTRTIDGGDVYGSSRGTAGDRYAMAHLAYVKETEVNVNYPTTYATPDEATIDNDFTTPCITGSVHGSGEDGYVYGDTHVTVNKGLIGHSVYGAGKGTGTYTLPLEKIGGGGTYDAKIYSLLAGRVMGNTYVTMNDGHVMRNVYGGGNMGSVGKGNYASGADDYANDFTIGAAMGYGEKITGNLWTSVSEGDDAWEFLHSGKATVKVLGGTVGYVNETNPVLSMKNELPYGNVFGGSAGEAAPNIAETPRYLYSPAFFSGYVNETEVTIGKTRADFATDGDYETYLASGTPKILASVYGGGQDGHVRRDTRVVINNGEIGMPYNDTNRTLLKTTGLSLEEELNNPMWMFRGNVHGAGSGITKYHFDFNGDGDTSDNDGSVTYQGKSVKEEDYSSSSGSVTHFTQVDINGGTIHRNVYGGGSLASVGPPSMGTPITEAYQPYVKGDSASGHGIGRQSYCQVNIRGVVGTSSEYVSHYGGEVYGASRGSTELNPDEFGYTIWTQVNIFKGAKVMGNVFGGGDAGIVKCDAEVNVGDLP